jgi:hypothetical protein
MRTKCSTVGLNGRDHPEDLDIDRRIIFKQILGKPVLGVWFALIF